MKTLNINPHSFIPHKGIGDLMQSIEMDRQTLSNMHIAQVWRRAMQNKGNNHKTTGA